MITALLYVFISTLRFPRKKIGFWPDGWVINKRQFFFRMDIEISFYRRGDLSEQQFEWMFTLLENNMKAQSV